MEGNHEMQAMREVLPMQPAFTSAPKQQLARKDIRRTYNVVIWVCLGAFIAFVLFSWLGSVLACYVIDGSTYRASIEVEDHWGNVRNPEISFSNGWYYWVTGSDVVVAGAYECKAGKIVNQYGWTFQISSGGTVLTMDGIRYRRVILNLNN